jgi:hypothetical protein
VDLQFTRLQALAPILSRLLLQELLKDLLSLVVEAVVAHPLGGLRVEVVVLEGLSIAPAYQ